VVLVFYDFSWYNDKIFLKKNIAKMKVLLIEMQMRIKSSLLLDIKKREQYVKLLPKLSEKQQQQLKNILDLERLMLTKLLEEKLKNPQKQKLYKNFKQSFNKGIKKAFNEKEIGQKREERELLLAMENEFESF
jgi:hypothetical protein